MEYVLVLDKLIGAVSAILNMLGSSKKVSAIVARRIAENREWTDAERQEIRADLAANKKYAQDELAKP